MKANRIHSQRKIMNKLNKRNAAGKWWVIGIILLCITIALISATYLFKWSSTGFLSKSLWDWMQLLIIPAVLAIGGYLFSIVSTANERKATQYREQADREIATDNQREAALQAYFDKMSELLFDKHLRTSKPEDEVRIVARVRTLTVLHTLDPFRKASLIQFLREADLINVSSSGSIIDMSGAELNNAALNGVDLYKVDLSNVNLSEANLSNATPIGANLSVTDLSKANMSHALLSESDLRDARINYANLSNADLSRADLSWSKLYETNLSKANLSGANLNEADLSKANLIGANLSEANLSDANLNGAIIDKLSLDKAALTKEQIASMTIISL